MTSVPGPSPFTDHKESVRAASVADIVLNNLPDTIDGVAMSYGDRFLAKDQNDPIQNGIYIYLGEDETAEVTTGGRDGQLTSGALVIVEEGTTNGDTLWVLSTDDPIEVGETELTFEQIGAEAPPAVDLLPLDNVWTGENEFQDTVRVTDTANVVLGDDSQLRWNASVTDHTIIEVTNAGDTDPRFLLGTNGGMAWGSGAALEDVTLSRDAAGALRVDGQIRTDQVPVDGDDLVNKDYADSLGGGGTVDILKIECQAAASLYANTSYQIFLYDGDTPTVTFSDTVDGVVLDGGTSMTFDGTNITINEPGLYRATYSAPMEFSHPTATLCALNGYVSTDTNARFDLSNNTDYALNGSGGVRRANLSGTGVVALNGGETIRFAAQISSVNAGLLTAAVLTTTAQEPGIRLTLERIGDLPV